MKILSKKGDTALVSSGSTSRQINIGLLKDAKTGDYVMVHAGFAIEKLDEAAAKKTLKILRQVKAYEIR